MVKNTNKISPAPAPLINFWVVLAVLVISMGVVQIVEHLYTPQDCVEVSE